MTLILPCPVGGAGAGKDGGGRLGAGLDGGRDTRLERGAPLLTAVGGVRLGPVNIQVNP